MHPIVSTGTIAKSMTAGSSPPSRSHPGCRDRARPGACDPERRWAWAHHGGSGRRLQRQFFNSVASRSLSSRWLLQETLGGGWTGGGKSRVWLAAEASVSSAALPSAVRCRQLVCQSGRSGLACSQSTNVASSQK